MALHFDLHISGHNIRKSMTIRRIDPFGDMIAPDTVGIYEATMMSGPDHLGGEGGTWTAQVTHRYGDGAWELIRKALDAILGAEH